MAQFKPRRGTLRDLSLVAAASMMLAACGMTPEEEAETIAQGILATPGAEDLWATILQEYRQDFDGLVERVQALDRAEMQDDEQLRQIGRDWLIEFMARIGPDAVRAPAEQLLVWSEAERDLYATLKRGAVEQCAALTMGQAVFVDPSNAAAISAITRRNTAMVKSAAAGKRDPQTYDQPNDADWTQLSESIAATGLDPALQETLGSQDAMLALSPAQQCEIGAALYAAIADLPDEVEPEMAAFMLAPEEAL